MQTSASAVVVGCIVSASTVSQASEPAPAATASAVPVLKLRPPVSSALPWLQATANVPPPDVTSPAPPVASVPAAALPLTITATTAAVPSDTTQKLVLRPPRAAQILALPVSPEGVAADTLPVVLSQTPVTQPQPPVTVVDNVVLRPPVNALPWLVHKQTASVEVAPQVLQTPALHKTVLRGSLSHLGSPVARQAVQAPVAQPVGVPHVLQTASAPIDSAPIDEETSANAEVAVVTPPAIEGDHTVWREEKDEAAQEEAPSPALVLTPPSNPEVPLAAIPTKTTLGKMETAVEHHTATAPVVVDPVVDLSSETHSLAVLEPAAGGTPTELMLTNSPATAANPVQSLPVPPLPKLNLPNVSPSQPVTVTVPAPVPTLAPAPASEDFQPQAAAVKKPALSEESKDILERLPPEPRRYSGKRQAVAVNRTGDNASAKDTVKKHEAYGMKIAVRRPKVDVFRTLESAYNSLIAGDQQYAITLYKEVLDEDPENTMALFGLATTYHRAGQLKMARPLYAQLLEIDPHHVEGLNNFLVLLADESPDEALRELEKLQRSHPSFSPVEAQMAAIYEKKGEFAKAVQKMSQALAISPENLKYQYNMAIILDRMGDWREAANWYQRLITAHERGEKIPGDAREIQQRLTFIRSNTRSAF